MLQFLVLGGGGGGGGGGGLLWNDTDPKLV